MEQLRLVAQAAIIYLRYISAYYTEFVMIPLIMLHALIGTQDFSN